MADRPLPEAPQVRCAHAPSLEGLRTLQVVRIRHDDAGARWSERRRVSGCPVKGAGAIRTHFRALTRFIVSLRAVTPDPDLRALSLAAIRGLSAPPGRFLGVRMIVHRRESSGAQALSRLGPRLSVYVDLGPGRNLH